MPASRSWLHTRLSAHTHPVQRPHPKLGPPHEASSQPSLGPALRAQHLFIRPYGSRHLPCCHMGRLYRQILTPGEGRLFDSSSYFPPHQMVSVLKSTRKEKEKKTTGAPAVVQQDQQHLGSAGMQAASPARHSGLRIQRCRSCGLGQDCSSDGSDPWPRAPYAMGWPK